MAYRYFSVEPLPVNEADYPLCVTLGGDEAHHLLHVMRVKEGESLILFDGSGAEFDTVIVATKKKELTAEIHARRVVSRELETEISLAVALPKGDRQKWLIEKLVELGASAFIPLDSERSVAKSGSGTADRLSRVVVEASKQCGRNALMRLEEPISTKVLFSSAYAEKPEVAETLKIVAHPGGKTLGEILRAPENQNRKILAAIGPEGGFSDAEVASAFAVGWIPVSLGNRILRTETAGIAICAQLN